MLNQDTYKTSITSQKSNIKHDNKNTLLCEQLCQICGESDANWSFGCVVCKACKKFFMRQQAKEPGICSSEKSCSITVATRSLCRYCRYKKCIDLGMSITLKFSSVKSSIPSTPCAVCSSPSSGIHFGTFSCEACKSFFRRTAINLLHQKEDFKCRKTEAEFTHPPKGIQQLPCEITTIKSCRACRYQKCIQVGMNINIKQMGRQSNIFKHTMATKRKYNEPHIPYGHHQQQEGDADEQDFFNCDQSVKRARYSNNFDDSCTTPMTNCNQQAASEVLFDVDSDPPSIASNTSDEFDQKCVYYSEYTTVQQITQPLICAKDQTMEYAFKTMPINNLQNENLTPVVPDSSQMEINANLINFEILSVLLEGDLFSTFSYPSHFRFHQ